MTQILSRLTSSLWGQFLLAILCGVLAFLSVPNFDQSYLAWIAFLPLLLAIRNASPKRSFFIGWVAGIVGQIGGFYWLSHLLMRFGKLSLPATIPIHFLFVAYQGLHWGAFAYLIRRTQLKNPNLPMALVAPIYMTAFELLMPYIFDWYMAISQAWVLPVIQVAEFAGPLGVTFLIFLVNGMIYDLLTAPSLKQGFRRKSTWIGASVLVSAIGFGFLRIHQIDALRAQAPQIKTGIVQANLGITQKGRRGLALEHHRIHLDESRKLQAQGAELIVWPESSYPFAMDRDRSTDWPEGDPRRVMQGIHVPILFGALSYSMSSAQPEPYNTAFMLNPDGTIVGRYDKMYLLMFGEYIPFYKQFPAFRKWIPTMSNFARGEKVTTFPFRNWTLGPLICYEDIIPSFGRAVGKLQPNALINITNDAWFGQTSEPYEHLALSVFRSVELRLDLVRAVNTGVSSFIDATGRVQSQTRSYDPAITPGIPPEGLLGTLTMLSPGKTVYAVVGDLFGYLNVIAMLGFIVFVIRNKRTRAEK